jgi:hypothetical protein
MKKLTEVRKVLHVTCPYFVRQTTPSIKVVITDENKFLSQTQIFLRRSGSTLRPDVDKHPAL